ncbi:hypothetical protein [Streptomyces sp. NPDC101206]|uniref:hypothetical protein n=1 Tax=Streptomyces sp. NPDC101206 TaxID=3366128 RepID=UPI00382A0F80
MAREELTRLTGNTNGGNCGQGDCPNVYRTASGSFVVQGDVSTAWRRQETGAPLPFWNR